LQNGSSIKKVSPIQKPFLSKSNFAEVKNSTWITEYELMPLLALSCCRFKINEI